MPCAEVKSSGHEDHMCITCINKEDISCSGFYCYDNKCAWKGKDMACGKFSSSETHSNHWCEHCDTYMTYGSRPGECVEECTKIAECLWTPKDTNTVSQETVTEEAIDFSKVILNKVNLISLNISLWMGKKTLTADDLASNGIDVNLLPPGSLASLGSKKTIDNAATAKFSQLKREAIVACSRYGIKFGDSAYMIPDNKTKDVCETLNIIKKKFLEATEVFMFNYDHKITEWIKSNPIEWQEAIRKSVDPVSKVKATLSFNFSAYKIDPVDSENGLEEELDGLYGQLKKEIKHMAKNALLTSYQGKSEVGRKALRPFTHIREKLVNLSFLSPEIKEAITDIDNALYMVEGVSKIDKNNLSVLVGTLARLQDFGSHALPEQAEEVPPDNTDDFSIVAEQEIKPVEKQEYIEWDF